MNEPTGFAEFWKAYPRRVAKGAAVKAWIKQGLGKSAGLQLMIATALEWQVQQERWIEQGGKFIPYPATWLNRWQWEDEPPKRAASYEWTCPHEPTCAARHVCHVKQQIAMARQ